MSTTNQAMYNGRELAREFIPRNNGYLGGNLIQDAEELAKAIREICQAHPQKTIRFN